jgi:hypothetical protein
VGSVALAWCELKDLAEEVMGSVMMSLVIWMLPWCTVKIDFGLIAVVSEMEGHGCVMWVCFGDWG